MLLISCKETLKTKKFNAINQRYNENVFSHLETLEAQSPFADIYLLKSFCAFASSSLVVPLFLFLLVNCDPRSKFIAKYVTIKLIEIKKIEHLKI